MPLNKQKGNMYGFITHTWNTIKGACPHDCSYCYMKRFGKQSELHFDEKELKTDLGNGNFIFVGSSCDMFAEYIPHEWIRKTLEYCSKFDNKYLFQSKNPRYMRRILPYNSTVCTTIETNRENNLDNTPGRYYRYMQFNKIRTDKKMITIEPIMDFDLTNFVLMLADVQPIQVNIGANTNRKVQLPEPPKEKVLELIAELKKFTRVYKKDNLKRIIGEF